MTPPGPDSNIGVISLSEEENNSFINVHTKSPQADDQQYFIGYYELAEKNNNSANLKKQPAVIRAPSTGPHIMNEYPVLGSGQVAFGENEMSEKRPSAPASQNIVPQQLN